LQEKEVCEQFGKESFVKGSVVIKLAPFPDTKARSLKGPAWMLFKACEDPENRHNLVGFLLAQGALVSKEISREVAKQAAASDPELTKHVLRYIALYFNTKTIAQLATARTVSAELSPAVLTKWMSELGKQILEQALPTQTSHAPMNAPFVFCSRN
jgi:hypothetical protein